MARLRFMGGLQPAKTDGLPHEAIRRLSGAASENGSVSSRVVADLPPASN
jgi:hypothetical protein